MLKKLYIDNYKCHVNSELNFMNTNLLMGENGTGKSVVFEVLQNIRTLVGGGDDRIGDEKVGSLFSMDSLTKWQKNIEQTFEIQVEGNKGIYQYPGSRI